MDDLREWLCIEKSRMKWVERINEEMRERERDIAGRR